jgi:hypothetical protein
MSSTEVRWKKEETMKLLRIAAAATMVASILMVGAGTSRAEEFKCRKTIGSRTLDNVKVPAEATCELNGTTVKGTITVKRGATLIARGVRVIGNVQAENARKVVVRGKSRVGGSVQVEQGRRALVRNSKINADIQYTSQRGRVRAINNRVGGNIQAMQNRGGVVIRRNVVDGNLQCKENRPRPIGGNNTVHGSKEDQCKNL